MKEIDRAAFAQGMLVLGETFNEPVSDVRIEAYFSALEDLPGNAVNAAVREAVRSLKFFPKPVELREMVEGVPADNADAAWGEVMREIRRVGWTGTPQFTDARTLVTIRELWGGWGRLCETLPAEGPELVGWIKQFKTTFGTQSRRESQKELTRANLEPNVRRFIDSRWKQLTGETSGEGA